MRNERSIDDVLADMDKMTKALERLGKVLADATTYLERIQPRIVKRRPNYEQFWPQLPMAVDVAVKNPEPEEDEK